MSTRGVTLNHHNLAIQDPEVVSAALDGHRPEQCCRELVNAGVGVRRLTTDRPSLEDAYVALTGEGFDVAG